MIQPNKRAAFGFCAEKEKCMYKRLLQSMLITCLAALIAIPAAAQNASSANNSGEKGQANAQDQNIKNDQLANAPGQKHQPPPARKGGPAAKGIYCDVHIDNRTPLIVSVYMNGDLLGVIGPWGDLYPDITYGTAQLYARAVFTDGSVLTFGPRNYQCVGGSYTWSLTP